jgi:hypothetical protein
VPHVFARRKCRANILNRKTFGILVVEIIPYKKEKSGFVETEHEQRVRTQTMKIIKPCSFKRAPRLRASPRHGGAARCLHICLQALIRRGDAPSGAAGLSQIIMRNKYSIIHIGLFNFHRKTSKYFS